MVSNPLKHLQRAGINRDITVIYKLCKYIIFSRNSASVLVF